MEKDRSSRTLVFMALAKAGSVGTLSLINECTSAWARVRVVRTAEVSKDEVVVSKVWFAVVCGEVIAVAAVFFFFLDEEIVREFLKEVSLMRETRGAKQVFILLEEFLGMGEF